MAPNPAGLAKSGDFSLSSAGFRGSTRSLHFLACCILAAIAFAFNWATGHRGVFFLDQSMIFDGGWRVLQGQVPYRDFFMPFGPVTVWIQALFFMIFGVNWTATVLSACLFNVAATLSAVRIVRLLGRGPVALCWCAGLATAICFQAPFGTIWFEQTAMFFDLLALQAVVESFEVSGRRRDAWQLASGLALTLAVLGKQNYGFFFVPVVLAVAAAGELPDFRRVLRSVLLVVGGLAISSGIFLAWLGIFSDFHEFIRRFFVVAGTIGRSRMNAHGFVTVLTFRVTPSLYRIDALAAAAGCTTLFFAGRNLLAKKGNDPVRPGIAPAAAAAILLPLFRSLTQTTTLNEWENNMAFVGLAVALGICLLLDLGARFPAIAPVNRFPGLRLLSARSITVCLMTLAGIWGAVVLSYISRASWQRTVQEFSKDARFHERVRAPGMRNVLWGEPTMSGKTTELRRADFEDLVAYLAEAKSGFFVMGDSTLLYGLLGVRPPQPLLYFQPVHSFLMSEIPRLDPIIASSLEQNDPSLVVREKFTWLPENEWCYRQFPILWKWFTSRFAHVADFGNYEVWRRKPDRQ